MNSLIPVAMNLIPYPNADDPIGYVESSKRGKRIIIVVDDFYNLPDWYKASTTPSTAGGLLKLYSVTRDWGSTRGIGFFNLPDPSKLQEDSDKIIDCIDDWLNRVCLDSSRTRKSGWLDEDSLTRDDFIYYMFIDTYFGTHYVVGHKFIERWKERQILPKDREHIAYLSTAGVALGWEDPHNLPIFAKGDIDNTLAGLLPDKLKTWLGFEATPLEMVWEKTVGWFNDSKSGIVLHNFTQVKEKFYDASSNSLPFGKYRHAIENALGFSFPEVWWQDLETVKNIHESLKSICGDVFCGNTNQPGCRNISVGATYLVALKAHYDIFRNIDPLASDPNFWKHADHITAAVFPLQGTKRARASAIALYNFFFRMFEPRNGAKEESQVEGAFFEGKGEVLKICLKWSASEGASDRAKSLAQQLEQQFDSNQIEIFGSERPGQMISNTRNAIAELWRTMVFNRDGFLSPGVVYMERDEIIIASTEYLVTSSKYF
ncbi:hypothetical protein [Trichothermofontia sp.]